MRQDGSSTGFQCVATNLSLRRDSCVFSCFSCVAFDPEPSNLIITDSNDASGISIKSTR